MRTAVAAKKTTTKQERESRKNRRKKRLTECSVMLLFINGSIDRWTMHKICFTYRRLYESLYVIMTVIWKLVRFSSDKCSWQKIIFLTTFYSFSRDVVHQKFSSSSSDSTTNVYKWSYAKKVTSSTLRHNHNIQVCCCVCARVYVVLGLCFLLLYLFSFGAAAHGEYYYYPFILIYSESQVTSFVMA